MTSSPNLFIAAFTSIALAELDSAMNDALRALRAIDGDEKSARRRLRCGEIH